LVSQSEMPYGPTNAAPRILRLQIVLVLDFLILLVLVLEFAPLTGSTALSNEIFS
jgi:hypothetical protein